MCLNNVRGTVCDNSWNSADANVVCSQLGFSRFGKLSLCYHNDSIIIVDLYLIIYKGARLDCCATYGSGSGPIHMTNVGCMGNELSLTDCPHSTNNNYHHSEDAGVQCQTSNY